MPDIEPPSLERISAITFMTRDLEKSLAFYRALGLQVAFESEAFVTLMAGESRINLAYHPTASDCSGWGRVILYVNDVDAWHDAITRQGIVADTEPRDAEWGERYFHITDPNGHQLSFAKPL